MTSQASGGSGGVPGTSSGGQLASGGDAGTGGSGGPDPDYPDPPREIDFDAARGNKSVEFSPTDADDSSQSFHGNPQWAGFDTDAPTIRKKLIVKLGGINSGAGGFGWGVERGYHVLGVDYWNEGPEGEQTEYLETWSGDDVSDAEIGAQNSIMHRVKSGLTYLQTIDAGADWAYYLDAAGEVRWSDVILFGYSYGGQTSVAATKYVALDRVVITSSPNINPSASWLTDEAKTPPERCVFIGGIEDGEHQVHVDQTAVLGFPGDLLNVTTLMPPYGTNRLEVNDGHSEFCGRPFNDGMIDWDSICEGAFGIR